MSKSDFQFVLDEVKSYADLNTPQKTSLLFRLLIKKLPIDQLHPNPEDEFCHENVGPNWEIISDYETKIQHAQWKSEPLFDEPLMVEKKSTGGYMILNGHHRWMAARRLGVKKVPVRILNVTPAEEVIQRVKQSERCRCASFDLDEVLLTDGVRCPMDKKLHYPLNKIYKKSLRSMSPALIRELQNMGFDIWVYTGDYRSELLIKLLFKLHNVRFDGIVNGKKSSKTRDRLKYEFSQNYKTSLHIDNEALISVNCQTKEYEVYDVNPDGAAWSADMFAHLKTIEFPV